MHACGRSRVQIACCIRNMQRAAGSLVRFPAAAEAGARRSAVLGRLAGEWCTGRRDRRAEGRRRAHDDRHLAAAPSWGCGARRLAGHRGEHPRPGEPAARDRRGRGRQGHLRQPRRRHGDAARWGDRSGGLPPGEPGQDARGRRTRAVLAAAGAHAGAGRRGRAPGGRFPGERDRDGAGARRRRRRARGASTASSAWWMSATCGRASCRPICSPSSSASPSSSTSAWPVWGSTCRATGRSCRAKRTSASWRSWRPGPRHCWAARSWSPAATPAASTWPSPAGYRPASTACAWARACCWGSTRSRASRCPACARTLSSCVRRSSSAWSSPASRAARAPRTGSATGRSSRIAARAGARSSPSAVRTSTLTCSRRSTRASRCSAPPAIT